MAKLHGKIRKVFCSILGSVLGLLGAAFTAIATELNHPVLLYLLGVPIGSSLGFTFAVWWERKINLKIGMFVVEAVIGTALALIAFWIVLKLVKNPLIGFWAAFVVANITIPILGITLETISNHRAAQDRR